ncbi:uncharacterized protein LOC122385694 [Amphibalanus amphitrite]|uniref:uncharacterized protein LOC122385694 n=1 Tax=Amphibalanus amphitrite TaxID=1232801 RepID=UPI001C920B45|nr:uncharacterized protein LOC122385694 [Amphibalanus amphitrite]
MGCTFVVRIRTKNPDQASFCPFALRDVSVASELALLCRPSTLRTRTWHVVGLMPSPAWLRVSQPKRVIITPAVYPRLDESLHFDIQSTGQKSHRVNTDLGHHNAMI